MVLYCLQQQRCVPKAESPVYNMAMADVTISCTSLEKATRVSSFMLLFTIRFQYCPNLFFFSLTQQTEVMELVQLMGGRVYLDLNVSVTHLIAGEVGSKKYLVAAGLGKPIVLPKWVKACWEMSQNRSLHLYTILLVNLSAY